MSTVVGVIFLRGSLEHIYLTLKEIKLMLISGWVVVIAIAIGISFLLTRTITRPIREVTFRAAALARGDFSRLIEVHSADEIGELGKMFNFLTKRLQETLKEISTEKNKVDAILNYMTDGVVAFNKEGQAIHLNPRPGDPSGGGPGAGQGLSWETMSSKLFRTRTAFVSGGRAGDERGPPGECPDKILQVHFAPLKKVETGRMLVVLHDVTKERSLTLAAGIRGQCLHELVTPLTTIKIILKRF